MMISTKGRYALRVMVDLAEHANGGYLAMREVAKRQEISLKYLERGGYRLTRDPSEYPIGEILRQTEGDLAPVSCLECSAAPCPRSADCRTLALWQELNRRVNDFLDSKTLADLMQTGS